MKGIRSLWTLALTAMLAFGLVGCGAPVQTVPLRGGISAESADIPAAEARAIQSLNADLEYLDEEDLSEEDFDEAYEEEAGGGYETMAATAGKRFTKLGYVRSDEDGKFFLQYKKGFWRKKDVSSRLEASEAASLKLARLLNKKVLVCGRVQNDIIAVRKLFGVPDLAIVTDLLTKGRIAGTVYDARTKQTLSGADLTLKGPDGRLYRTKSRRSGRYYVGRLPAGEYTISATLASYERLPETRVLIKRRKKLKLNLGLTPGLIN